MRAIIEIGEHSIYQPALTAGGAVLDAGANKGRFGDEMASRFSCSVISVEPNPVLARALREKGARVLECALGTSTRIVAFNIGDNDEASSLLTPSAEGSLLVIRETVEVAMRTLEHVLAETGVSRFACVKLDVDGAENDVLRAVAARASSISPQWTVEFHDHPQFRLSTSEQVDETIRAMRGAGFSVLVRDWPSRTNVLFLDRRSLSISSLTWWTIKLRYQYVAHLWRRLIGI